VHGKILSFFQNFFSEISFCRGFCLKASQSLFIYLHIELAAGDPQVNILPREGQCVNPSVFYAW